MGPYKCPDCGVWWAGFEHRCLPVNQRTHTGTGETFIRPVDEPVGSGSATLAPWCPICHGWHIPGQGACTRTYSVVV